MSEVSKIEPDAIDAVLLLHDRIAELAATHAAEVERLTRERDLATKELQSISWFPKKDSDCGQYHSEPIERRQELEAALAAAQAQVQVQEMTIRITLAIELLKCGSDAGGGFWSKIAIYNLDAALSCGAQDGLTAKGDA